MKYTSYQNFYDLKNRKDTISYKPIIITISIFLLIGIFIRSNPAFLLLQRMVLFLGVIIIPIIVYIIKQPPIKLNENGIFIHKTYITGDLITLHLITALYLNDKFNLLTIKTEMQEDIKIQLSFKTYWELFPKIKNYAMKYQISFEREVLK
jgi:hypothetical protein